MNVRYAGRVLVAVVLAAMLLAGFTATAMAAPTAPYDRAECVQCHDETTGSGATTRVDFVVPAVDYGTCSNCHWLSMSTWVPASSFKHNHGGGRSCKSCHPTYQIQDTSRLPYTSTAYGYFNTAASTSATPESIHAIHVNGSWPKIGAVDPNWCGSCHMPASCDSCHTGFDAAKHSDHTWNPLSSTYGYPPVAYTVAGGVVPSVYGQASAYTKSSTCINAACHDPASTIGPANTPDCVSCHPTRTSAHGAESVDHTSDQTATTDASMPASAAWTTVTAFGKTCGACHDMTVTTEHARTGASTAAAGCGACHEAGGTGAGDKEASHTLTPPTGWSQTCGTNFWCHKTATPTQRHTGYTPAHTSSTSACSGGGCHDISNVANLHVNATATVAGWTDNGGVAKSCNVCHRKGYDGASTDCNTCHAGHGDLTAVHTANPASPTANPSSACIACHETGDVRTVHTALGCAVCHNNVTRIPSIATRDANCASCHDKPTDTLSPKDYFPVDPNHYTGTESTHTATETGFEGGKACGTCHYLEMKPEHSRASNTPTWSCVQCHETNVDPWAGTPWNDRCGACHSGGTAQHTAMSTLHVSSTSQCSGAGCHDLTDVSTIHSAAATTVAGVGALTSCNVCHYDKDRIFGPTDGSRKTTNCTVCHSSINVATHGKHVLNRASSDASLTAVTGCTNSGAGCHGADTTTTPNYQTPYHPASGCAAGPCHTSPSKASKVAPITCQGCHDGTYTGAVHVDVLTTTTAGGGHYNPATHTVTATNTTGLVTAGGTASAQCSNCHGNTGTGLTQLYKQHQGLPAPYTNTTCFDCHNYNAAVSGIVSTSWPTKRCNACHTTAVMGAGFAQHATTAPSVTATSALSCGSSGAGCHQDTNLHSIHRNAAGGCALSNCHNYSAQAAKPVFKGCGAGGNCHTGYSAATHGTITGDDTTHTAINMTTQISTGTFSYGNQCVTCHSATLKTSHTTVTANLVSGNPAWTQPLCTNCHNATTPVNSVPVIKSTGWTTDSCYMCHSGATHSTYTTATHTASLGTTNTLCGDAACHKTLDVRTIHNKATSGCGATGTDNKGWSGTCHAQQKQMTGTAMSCGQGTTGCHTSHTNSNHGGNHVVASALATECVDCHPAADTGLHDGDLRGIHKNLGDGCNVCHGSYVGTFGTYNTIRTGKTSNCTDCHVSGVIGTRTYADTTTSTVSGARMLPHYNLSATMFSANATHTVASWASTATVPYNGGYACTTCHSAKLWDSHSVPTTNSLETTTAARNKICVGCHEDSVEGWAADAYGSWTAQAAGRTCTACHATAATHQATSTAHNASTEVMSAPGSSAGSVSTVETEDFGTSTTWPSDYTCSNTTYVTNQNGGAHAGYAAQIGVNTTRTEYNFYKDINLSTYTSASLTFWYAVNVSSTSDFLVVEYSTNGGTNYTTLMTQNTDALTWVQSPSYSIPTGGNVRIRFRGTFNASGEYGRVDDILITGQTGSTALPAGTTAAAACQNNPNGTDCHNVADVAALHAGTTAKCTACHVNATTTPLRNCQSVGCHVGVNRDEHIQTGIGTPNHHESPMSSTAVFGTGFSGTSCTGCHDNSIANEHFVLTAYSSTPCRICHEKTTNSGAPTNVTVASNTVAVAKAAGTALCTDCHGTVTAARPHVQRRGLTGVAGATQFDLTYSGHRVYNGITGAKTSGTLNGQTINATNWTLPSNATWLKSAAAGGAAAAQLTPTSMVWCSDCHGSVAGASGPHGAAMAVNYAAGYDNSFTTGGLYINGGSMSNTTALCNKCHVSNVSYNSAHSDNNHWGNSDGVCIDCHIKVPHVWKRPRLIGYTSDPAPYASTGLTGIGLTHNANGPNGWTQANCGGCGRHTVSGSAWP